MHRFLTLSFGASLLLQLIPACVADEVFPVAHNEPIAVRVADGNSGKPLQNQHVLLLAGYDRRDLDMALWREEAVTDGEGKVRLSNTLRNLPLLRVEVLKRHNCQPGWDEAAFSMERIRLEGLSGVDRCGDLVAKDAAGVLTVFVKGKEGDMAGVDAPPAPVAGALPSTPAIPTPVAAVSFPADAHTAPESPNRPQAAGDEARAAEPPAEAALPPIPFALPSDFFSATDRVPDSRSESIAVPPAPRVVTHSRPAKPGAAPAAGAIKSGSVPSPSSKPAAAAGRRSVSRKVVQPTLALRHAVAVERGRKRAVRTDARDASPAVQAASPAAATARLDSHAKPSAGHAPAVELGRSSTSHLGAAEAPAAHSAPAPPEGSAPAHVPAAMPARQPASSPPPTPSPSDRPDEDGVDPMCAQQGGQV